MLSKNAIRQQFRSISQIGLVAFILVCFPTNIKAQTVTPQQQCQLISANAAGADPFLFVPKNVKGENFKNRAPLVSFAVDEDGRVSNVKVVKTSGSKSVDAGLVKSVEAWKYKPQAGCKFKMTVALRIDVGHSE